MVQKLQALKREVEERADEKLLFIEKLKGNVPLIRGMILKFTTCYLLTGLYECSQKPHIMENGGHFVAIIKANKVIYRNRREVVVPVDLVFRMR
ncbi:hypothetical protein Tco_0128137 [Tanacetum coccineum]